jgi:hypothetical protein
MRSFSRVGSLDLRLILRSRISSRPHRLVALVADSRHHRQVVRRSRAKLFLSRFDAAREIHERRLFFHHSARFSGRSK